MAGEYRQPEVLAKIDAPWVADIRAGRVRIASTSQPITGAVRRPDLIPSMAEAYRNVGLAK